MLGVGRRIGRAACTGHSALIRRVFPMASSSSSSMSSSSSSSSSPSCGEKQTRVLFCGQSFPAGFEFTKEYLKPYPFIQVDALPHEEIPEKINEYDICIVRMMKFDSQIISCAKKLKLMMQFGVGLEGVDIECALQAGISVGRIPSLKTGNALSCAEHAIYLILALLRDQKGMMKSVEEKRLGTPAGATLFGKTVLIFGYGNIGKELALRLKPFGIHLLAIRRRWSETSASVLPNGFNSSADFIDERGGNERLPDFLGRADIVVMCSPVTPETAGIVNEKFISNMKKGAFLINIARGGLLDYAAIKTALETDYLGGLGIDVAWVEPFDPLDPIVAHPKVLITPHIAGVTEFSYRNMSKIVGDTVLQFHAGQDLTEIELVS